MTDVANIFGKNLKRLRTQRELTQLALAEQLGLSDVAVYNYEKGAQFPRSDVLNALCKILKIRPWQLLAEEGEGSAIPPELVDQVAALARSCGLKISAGKNS